VKVAVISGGGWPQFEKQLVSNLPTTNFWLIYLSFLLAAQSFTDTSQQIGKRSIRKISLQIKEKRSSIPKEAIGVADFKIEKLWGEQIEDREARYIFCLRSESSLGRKGKWDPISPSGRRSKLLLTISSPSFLSESGARHLSTLPSRD